MGRTEPIEARSKARVDREPGHPIRSRRCAENPTARGIGFDLFRDECASRHRRQSRGYEKKHHYCRNSIDRYE